MSAGRGFSSRTRTTGAALAFVGTVFTSIAPFAVVAVTMLHSPSLSAAPARRVRDALSGEALSAFDRATTLFADGDAKGARAEFERAYELSREARILYNVAVCDKTLRRYARALEELRRSLQEGGAKLPKEYVRTVEDTITALEPFVSKLLVTSEPEGGAIIVDGEKAGETPLEAPLVLEVGEHVVSVLKPGYLDIPQKIRVTSGETAKASFKLETAVERGLLRVTAVGLPRDTHALVSVDGVLVGATPLETMFDAGPHMVTLSAPGFAPVSKQVLVSPRTAAEVTERMVAESSLGRLRVRTDSASDLIELDGREVGKGSLDSRVPAGKHTVRVSRPGADAREEEVDVKAQTTRDLNLSLDHRPIPAWVWITGASVLTVAGAVTAVVLLTRQTEFEGSSPGTLAPRVVPASWSFR